MKIKRLILSLLACCICVAGCGNDMEQVGSDKSNEKQEVKDINAIENDTQDFAIADNGGNSFWGDRLSPYDAKEIVLSDIIEKLEEGGGNDNFSEGDVKLLFFDESLYAEKYGAGAQVKLNEMNIMLSASIRSSEYPPTAPSDDNTDIEHYGKYIFEAEKNDGDGRCLYTVIVHNVETDAFLMITLVFDKNKEDLEYCNRFISEYIYLFEETLKSNFRESVEDQEIDVSKLQEWTLGKDIVVADWATTYSEFGRDDVKIALPDKSYVTIQTDEKLVINLEKYDVVVFLRSICGEVSNSSDGRWVIEEYEQYNVVSNLNANSEYAYCMNYFVYDKMTQKNINPGIEVLLNINIKPEYMEEGNAFVEEFMPVFDKTLKSNFLGAGDVAQSIEITRPEIKMNTASLDMLQERESNSITNIIRVDKEDSDDLSEGVIGDYDMEQEEIHGDVDDFGDSDTFGDVDVDTSAISVSDMSQMVVGRDLDVEESIFAYSSLGLDGLKILAPGGLYLTSYPEVGSAEAVFNAFDICIKLHTTNVALMAGDEDVILADTDDFTVYKMIATVENSVSRSYQRYIIYDKKTGAGLNIHLEMNKYDVGATDEFIEEYLPAFEAILADNF